MTQPLGTFPLSLTGARIPGAVLRLQNANTGSVRCDPNVAIGSYQHAQPLASATWVINHNFGHRPNVSLWSVGGRAMLAEIMHTSLNQAVVYFDNPVAGYATCS